MSRTETRVGSIDDQDHEDAQKKVKSRRPASKLTLMGRLAQRNADLCSTADTTLCAFQILPSGNSG